MWKPQQGSADRSGYIGRKRFQSWSFKLRMATCSMLWVNQIVECNCQRHLPIPVSFRNSSCGDTSEAVESVCVEQLGRSETSCRRYELIDCYESAKLPVYIFIRKLGTQLLIRSLQFRLTRS
jgi:hypothetical protein